MSNPRAIIRGGVAAAIQTSLPGFNVLTAPLSGMAFDARFANLRVYAHTALVIGGAPTTPARRTSTYWFGETLPTPPLCLAHWRDPRLDSFGMRGQNFVYSKQDNRTEGGVIAEIYADRAEFSSINLEANSNIPSYVVTFFLLRQLLA